jgi:hypothetical protein
MDMGNQEMFDDEYFGKHRVSNTRAPEKDDQKVYKYLNVKNMPVKKEVVVPVEENAAEADELDQEMEDSNKSRTFNFNLNLNTEILKLLISGFMGGLIIFIFGLKYILKFPVFSFVFWASVIEVFLMATIVVIVLGFIFSMLKRD